MKTTLITGLSGFIGGHMVQFLKENHLDDSVIALSSHKIEGIETLCYAQGHNLDDIVIPSSVTNVIHMGAWTPQSTSEANNIEASMSNIGFTNELLRKLNNHNIHQIVFLSTLDVYAPTCSAINEQSDVNPISLYGDSKVFCEKMVMNWCKQHNAQSQILRIGHIYGEGEEQYKKIIPILFGKIIRGQEIEIFSDGQEKRSFLYVKEAVNYIWEAQSFQGDNVVNVVSGNAVSMLELAQTMVNIAHKSVPIRVLKTNMETRDMLFDKSHMQSLFPIKERSISEGLEAEYNYMMRL